MANVTLGVPAVAVPLNVTVPFVPAAKTVLGPLLVIHGT
jgi:hypothetical protein